MNFPALAKFASNIEDIKSEFDEIPQITAKTSELPDGCEPKNRYANVIPLPETRVNLRPIDGYPNSDYINANYVTVSFLSFVMVDKLKKNYRMQCKIDFSSFLYINTRKFFNRLLIASFLYNLPIRD